MGLVHSLTSAGSSTKPVAPHSAIRFSELRPLDLVLYRHTQNIQDTNLDSQLVFVLTQAHRASIHTHSVTLARYDRVAIIDTVTDTGATVIEASVSGVRTATLAEIVDRSSELAVRRLHVFNDRELKSHYQTLSDVAIEAPSLSTSAGGDSHDGRKVYESQFQAIISNVVNKPFNESAELLKPLIVELSEILSSHQLSSDDRAQLEQFVDHYVDENSQVPYNTLLTLLRDLRASPAFHCAELTEKEIYGVFDSFADGNPLSKYSNEGNGIGKQELLSHLASVLSATRTTRTVRELPAMISAMLVSHCYQIIGIDADGEQVLARSVMAFAESPCEWSRGRLQPGQSLSLV